MDSAKYTRYLSAIGVPYSSTEEIDSNILPEFALCLASPLLYSDAKACSLTFTLLKNNFDLFDDHKLSEQISDINDKLAIAMLGGILDKANKNYFSVSIRNCIKLSRGADITSIKKSMHILADHGRLPYDESLQSLFGIKINEIAEADRKKTIPRSALLKRNIHFGLRKSFEQKSVRNLSKPTNLVEQVKVDLCHKFISLSEKHSLKQKEIAILIHASPAQMNEIVNFRLDRFTIDFLIKKTQILITSLKNDSEVSVVINLSTTVRN
jgi:predicted XRE-type DNA-binding protein